MIVLGLLLILVAAGIVVFALVSSSNYTVQIPLHGIGLSFTATPLTIYLAGAVSVVFIGLGVALILRGTGREWGRHKEHRELKQLRKDKAITATQAAADHKAFSANDGAKDSTAGSTDKSTETPRGRHATAEQHSSV